MENERAASSNNVEYDWLERVNWNLAGEGSEIVILMQNVAIFFFFSNQTKYLVSRPFDRGVLSNLNLRQKVKISWKVDFVRC